MKKLVKMLYVLVTLGAVFIFMAGCEEGYIEYEEYEEEPFDFSEHMRIDDCFGRIDVEGFENVGAGSSSVGLRISVRGFEENSSMIAESRRVRVGGDLSWNSSFCFEVRLNGDVVPYGDPQHYESLKYGAFRALIQLGTSLFFTDLDLEEGRNVVEFFMIQESTEQMAHKTIYIYYN